MMMMHVKALLMAARTPPPPSARCTHCYRRWSIRRDLIGAVIDCTDHCTSSTTQHPALLTLSPDCPSGAPVHRVCQRSARGHPAASSRVPAVRPFFQTLHWVKVKKRKEGKKGKREKKKTMRMVIVEIVKSTMMIINEWGSNTSASASH